MAEEATDKPAEKEYQRPRGPKTKYTPKDDIAKEPYKGPGVLASAAGEGYIAHIKWAVIGFFSGAGISSIFHKTAEDLVNKARALALPKETIDAAGKRIIQPKWYSGAIHALFGTGLGTQDSFRTAAESHIENGAFKHDVEAFEKWAMGRELGFGHWVLSHVPGVSGYLEKLRIAEQTVGLGEIERAAARTKLVRITTPISVGGIAAAAGFFLVPLLFAGRGAKRGLEGKGQFARAKDEIWTLRAEYDALRQKYLDTKLQMEDLRTTQGVDSGQLTISKDEPPKLEEGQSSAAPAPAETLEANQQPKRKDEPAAAAAPPTTVVTSISREAAVAAPRNAVTA